MRNEEILRRQSLDPTQRVAWLNSSCFLVPQPAFPHSTAFVAQLRVLGSLYIHVSIIIHTCTFNYRYMYV